MNKVYVRDKTKRTKKKEKQNRDNPTSAIIGSSLYNVADCGKYCIYETAGSIYSMENTTRWPQDNIKGF